MSTNSDQKLVSHSRESYATVKQLKLSCLCSAVGQLQTLVDRKKRCISGAEDQQFHVVQNELHMSSCYEFSEGCIRVSSNKQKHAQAIAPAPIGKIERSQELL